MAGSAPAPEGLDYFGRGHRLGPLHVRYSLEARRRMFQRWLRWTGGGSVTGQSLLDVGATPDRERQDSNCMIPWFHQAGLRVSLYSPEDISGLPAAFPFASVLPSRGFGAPIPAQAQQYDWASASAVLEHVGGREAQVQFIRDCARVARGLFLTTPSRWHWLEFHTKLPLLHWLPRRAHRACLRALGHASWAQESFLRLVGRRELHELAAAALGDAFDFEVQSIWTLGMPSNLLLLARRRR